MQVEVAIGYSVSVCASGKAKCSAREAGGREGGDKGFPKLLSGRGCLLAPVIVAAVIRGILHLALAVAALLVALITTALALAIVAVAVAPAPFLMLLPRVALAVLAVVVVASALLGLVPLAVRRRLLILPRSLT